jgi:hypothetical protein
MGRHQQDIVKRQAEPNELLVADGILKESTPGWRGVVAVTRSDNRLLRSGHAASFDSTHGG